MVGLQLCKNLATGKRCCLDKNAGYTVQRISVPVHRWTRSSEQIGGKKAEINEKVSDSLVIGNIARSGDT